MRGRGPSAAIVAALQRLIDLGVVEELRRVGAKGATRRARAAFGEFVRRTGDDWGRMARDLYRRWSVPAAVQSEDVLEELLMAAWLAIPDWDPGLRPLADYVVWNACARARKWINQQRNAYRRDGRNASRHPISESQLANHPGRSSNGTDRRRSVLDQEESVWFQEHVSAESRIDGGRLAAEIVGSLPHDEAEAFALLVEECATPGPRSPEYRAARRLSGAARLRNGLGSEKKVRGFLARAHRSAVEVSESVGEAAA